MLFSALRTVTDSSGCKAGKNRNWTTPAGSTEDFDYDILVASALLHDVGIKQSEAVLGYNDGATQEKYGPPVAGQLLDSIGFPPEKTRKTCEIIGNHHSRSRYDYVELRILKEADRIVNKIEGD